MSEIKHDQIRSSVRESYSRISQGSIGSCCSSSSTCCGSSVDEEAVQISAVLGYSKDELHAVPQGANLGLGCGNPQAIAALKPGEVVLDLGSGAGFDCFLAARSVGEQGKVIGVDMTPAMVTKARQNLQRSTFLNIEFCLGEIENLPVVDGIIDVIISNCVINLSPEKDRVFFEVFRVLKPGGRLAISDVVRSAELPNEVKENMRLYSSCISGASSILELETMLKQAGFDKVQIVPRDSSQTFIKEWQPGSNIEDYVISASIEAVKPFD